MKVGDGVIIVQIERKGSNWPSDTYEIRTSSGEVLAPQARLVPISTCIRKEDLSIFLASYPNVTINSSGERFSQKTPPQEWGKGYGVVLRDFPDLDLLHCVLGTGNPHEPLLYGEFILNNG